MRTLNYIDPFFSPLPAFRNVTSRNYKPVVTPKKAGSAKDTVVIKAAKGAILTDTNNNEFVDFYHSHGTNILGHHPDNLIKNIASYGMSTPAETLLTDAIREAIPSIDQVRLVSSGTNAVMSAIRLARTFTGKRKVIKFDGSIHGDSGPFQVYPGLQLEFNSKVSSHGIPNEIVNETIELPFNNVPLVLETFAKYRDDIAAIIVEPVPVNNGVILPDQGFLKFLRKVTSEHQSLLLFDEITTGFRPKLSGAQGYFGVTPDLTILGKIIGGGFSMGAFGGRGEIMSLFTDESSVDYTGPDAIKAGYDAIQRLKSPLFYKTLNHISRDFIFCLKEITKDKGIVIHSFQSIFSIWFSGKEINNYADSLNSDSKRFKHFHKKVWENGIFLSPSQHKANFISMAHTPADLNRTLEVVNLVLKTL